MPGSHRELRWGHVGTVDRFDCAGLTVTGFDSFDRFDCASGMVMSDTCPFLCESKKAEC